MTKNPKKYKIIFFLPMQTDPHTLISWLDDPKEVCISSISRIPQQIFAQNTRKNPPLSNP